MIFKTPKFWQNNNITSCCLLPFSFIYLITHKIYFYFQIPKKFNKIIICVGNIIAGGAGKTPSAIAIANLLQNQNYKIAFACKNYIGKNLHPKMINKTLDLAFEVSDEPLLLAKTAPTFIAKNRIDAIKLACKDNNINIVIVDDGLQNNRFISDIKIMVVDSKIQFGNKKLLPAGPLRETFSRIEKFDFILQIGGNKKTIKELEPYQNKLFVLTRQLQTPNLIKDKYIAFSGIAYPEKFFNSLKQLKMNVVKKIKFPDHYLYKDNDLTKLQDLAKKLQAQLITTEKDYVRINHDQQKDIQFLKMTLEFNEEQKLIKQLQKKLNAT